MERLERLHQKARNLELTPGVYIMKDKGQNVIYVGKAKMLKNRVSSYFTNINAHLPKVYRMVEQVEDFDYIVTTSEFEALVLECSLIKQYKPKYNILLKDDKGYNYIKIEKGRYPKIVPAMQMTEGNFEYLGPFTSTYTVTNAVEQANKIFMLPTCGKSFDAPFKPARPCLNFYIKQCIGVCSGKVGQKTYDEAFQNAVSYLKKGSTELIEVLTQDMEKAAENLQFEKAAALRDKINAVMKINQTQKVYMINAKAQDVIAIASNDTIAVVTVIKFRNRMLVDKEEFVFYDVFDLSQIRLDFISSYYINKGKTDLPNSVLIDENFGDIDLATQLLCDVAGKTVHLTVATTSDHKKLTEIAYKNAVDKLGKVVGRTTKELTALEQLQKMLNLPKTPLYIESYDISNLGDSNIVAGMVVFSNGRPLKSAYKRFMLKDIKTQDDYGSMKEVITRRFRHYFEDEPTKNADGEVLPEQEGFKKLPDLILLDGGKGHVGVVAPLIEELGLSIPVFGMVKDNKHKTKAVATDSSEVSFTAVKSAFTLVTSIQDEVHRFALAYQKQKRKAATFELTLTQVKGIGTQKAIELMKHFKTQRDLKEATVEELQTVAKINEETATRLKEFITQ